MNRTFSGLRYGVLVLFAAATVYAVAALTSDVRDAPTTQFDDLLLAGAGWTVLGCSVWALVIVLAVGAELSGVARGSGRMPPLTTRLGCPPWARRALLVVCGAAVTAAGPTLAHADPPDHSRLRQETTAIGGLALPERPAGSTSTRLRVDDGDSLWAIAARDLPETATAADIDPRWRAIYAANADRIGADPDLIHPGTWLDLPERTAAPDRPGVPRPHHTPPEESS